jgi:hypothetical protein
MSGSNTSRGRVLCGFGVLVLACTTVSQAASFNLVSGNSAATIDTESAFGLYGWEVDGVNHLNQHFLWYRVGSLGPEDPIHVGTSYSTIDNGDDFVSVAYEYVNEDSGQQFRVESTYQLFGATSSLVQTITVLNTAPIDGPQLDLHLFHYADFDVDGQFDDNVLTITGSTLTQTGPEGGTVQTLVSLAPHHVQAGIAPDVVSLLEDEFPTTLDDTSNIQGDATYALQWDLLLNPGESITFTITHTVPEPACLGLAALGLVLGRRARRRLA